jgi:hypothetical protein
MDEPSRTEELTATSPFLSARPRARVVMFLLLACVAASLFSIFSSYLQVSFISDVLAGAELPDEAAVANDARESLSALLWLVVFAASAVAFLVWIHRAYRNLTALGNPERHLEYSPGWAVGSYFIPFANLVWPYKVMRELWTKSDPKVRTADDLTWYSSGAPPLVTIWWLAWIAAGVVGRLSITFADNARDPDAMLWATKFSIAADALALAAAVFAFLVVRGVTARQDERALYVRHVASAPPPPPLYARPEAPADPSR